MFTRMLLPLDGTKRAEDAIPVARELAKDTGAEVVLLHVAALAASTIEEMSITHQIEGAAQLLNTAGVSTQTMTAGATGAQGIANAIAAVVENKGVDLIVLAPEARNLMDGLRHPSVTAQVMAQTAAPVLVVPTPMVSGESSRPSTPKLLEFGDSQVIVPLDGSPLAEKALPLAIKIARESKRPLLLVRALPPVQPMTTGFETYALTRDAADTDLRVAREYLSSARARLTEAERIDVHTMLLEGIPTESLLALTETKPGSLVVMSTHGRTGLARLILGSVTLVVARKSTIPVLIVPTLVRDATEAHAMQPGGAKGALTR